MSISIAAISKEINVGKEIPADQMIGKEVAGYAIAESSDQLLLTFTDGTFTAFGLEGGGWDNAPDIASRPLDSNWFDPNTLLKLGMISEDERDEIANNPSF